MIYNYAQIIRRFPIGDKYSLSIHFGGVSPSMIQINFDIPLYEGQIDVDVVDKWLNLIKEHFLVHSFSNREKISFALLKAIPQVKYWWENYCDQRAIEESKIFSITPTWDSFTDVIKE
jgi:hypothetical protein